MGIVRNYWPMTDANPTNTPGSIIDLTGNDTGAAVATMYTDGGVEKTPQSLPGEGYTVEPLCYQAKKITTSAKDLNAFDFIPSSYNPGSGAASFGWWQHSAVGAFENVGERSFFEAKYNPILKTSRLKYQYDSSPKKLIFQLNSSTDTHTPFDYTDYLGSWNLWGITETYDGVNTTQSLYVNGMFIASAVHANNSGYLTNSNGTGDASSFYTVDTGGSSPWSNYIIKYGAHFYITENALNSSDWLQLYSIGIS